MATIKLTNDVKISSNSLTQHIDQSNVLATLNERSYTATQDCVVFLATTFNGAYGQYYIGNQVYGGTSTILLKTGDTITYKQGGVQILVFGLK